MFGQIGWREIAIILLIGFAMFGAGRLPNMIRALSKSISDPPPADKEDPPKTPPKS